MEDPRPLLGLSAIVDTVGSRRLEALLRAAGSPAAAWRAGIADLGRWGWPPNLIERFVATRSTIDVDALRQWVERERLLVIERDDSRYPPLLAAIPDPPIALFVRGNPDALRTPSVAIVGTRACTPYGLAATRHLVGPLARAGCTITSGLALGIDGEAHRACLAARGCTVAVLGTGLDAASVSPARHRSLAEQIVAAGGAIVSEYVPGTEGLPMHFPARNRIVAGLTLGTVVVEAPEDSGALITGRFALDFGREVFAVPGPITTPSHAGVHALLKSGATPVTCAEDVLTALRMDPIEIPNANPNESSINGVNGDILRALSATPIPIDDLAEALTVDIAALTRALTTLELDGVVRDVGGGRYVKC